MGRNEYTALLREIESHLSLFGERKWAPRLAEWLREYESAGLDSVMRRAHYDRTRRSLGGMGSIADIVITPEAGHRIANDRNAIDEANERLIRLVQRLDREVERLLVDGM